MKYSEKYKSQILDGLRKTPIVQVVSEKTGIGRATYYRWREKDREFAQKADEAIEEGLNLVNDMAESQLMAAIRDGNMSAITYWLRNHHKRYTNKIELSGTINHTKEELTSEQEELVRKALVNAGLITKEGDNDEKRK